MAEQAATVQEKPAEVFEWEVGDYVYYGPRERERPGRKRQQANFKHKGDRFWATEADVEPEKWKVRKVRRYEAAPIPPPEPSTKSPTRKRKIDMKDTMIKEPPEIAAVAEDEWR